MSTISSLSSEYVLVPVTFTVSGSITDPTGDAVSMAFLPPGTDPAGGDWVAGSWESDTTITGHPVRYARCLVGPSGKVLSKGSYTCWVRISDSPEVPVKQAGLLQVV